MNKMANMLCGVLVILTLSKTTFGQTQPIQDLKDLYNATLTGYDTRIRPRLYQSETVLVNSSFVPNNIIEFDTTEQKFSILGRFRIAWIDEVLTWNPASYSYIDTVKIPVKEIWRPSLILSKAFDGSGIIGEVSTDIVSVTSEGLVTWSPEGIFSYVCEVDIQFYPFDEQTCVLTYYVSDETRTTVSLSHYDDVTLEEYIKNSEWDLVDISRTTNLRYNAWFIDITFKVQRRASFATFTIIVPLLMLSFLNICVFLVPIGSGEKGSFCITIFLSYGIFVTIVSDTLPHNSLQVSYFVLFLIVLLMLSVLSVFYTIIQAKVVAAFGDKECKLPSCFSKKKRQIHPEKSGDSVVSLQDMEGEETKGPVVVTVDSVQDLQKEDYPEKSEKDGEDKDGEEKDDEDIFTWTMFFQTLDTILFCIFFVLIVISSSVFFSLMMQRIGSNTLSQVNPS